MPNLADSLMCSRFLSKLVSCERNIADLSKWERQFVRDLRERFDNRETMEDLGVTPWSPTANQWNTLSLMAEKYS